MSDHKKVLQQKLFLNAMYEATNEYANCVPSPPASASTCSMTDYAAKIDNTRSTNRSEQPLNISRAQLEGMEQDRLLVAATAATSNSANVEAANKNFFKKSHTPHSAPKKSLLSVLFGKCQRPLAQTMRLKQVTHGSTLSTAASTVHNGEECDGCAACKSGDYESLLGCASSVETLENEDETLHDKEIEQKAESRRLQKQQMRHKFSALDVQTAKRDMSEYAMHVGTAAAATRQDDLLNGEEGMRRPYAKSESSAGRPHTKTGLMGVVYPSCSFSDAYNFW